MADTSKDTIYIDVDDEITTVIDKVVSTKNSIVALVLPKRAAVFQSIVNMKLLKLKADNAGKNLVLITTESSLFPLAGSVGLYVAKTLASKPEIPKAPDISEAMVEANEDDPIKLDELEEKKPDVDLKSIADKPVGELAEPAAAGAVAGAAASKLDKDIETIELDNQAIDPAEAEKEDETNKKNAKKPKKDKSKKVPNFERFRKYLILGVILIVIIVVLILALGTLPHATIDIKTDAANVNSSVNFTMSTTGSYSTNNNVVPAKEVNEPKTYTATVNSTGQQNNGQSATGTVQLSAGSCTANIPQDVPAGTGLSANSLTFITQEDTTFVPTNSHGKCVYVGETSNGSSNIAITAQNGGSNYNVSNATFTVSGYPDVSGTGSASGGTDDIVQVVSQADITNAENKITTNNAGAKQDLTNQLNQANFYPITATFTAGTPTITPNASAGTAATSVTVTETVAYTMYGVNYNDLKTLVNSNITSQVSSNQSILNNGLSSATYDVGSSPTDITVQTTAEVGPNINVNSIKQQIAGKKSADIESLVQADSHVTSVSVHFSPFYVSTAPNNINKITVNIAKPTGTSSNGSN